MQHSKPKPQVCLLASHPAALREMRRALRPGRYEIRGRALPFALDGLEPDVPFAHLYVIDIEGPSPSQTASLVAEVVRKRPNSLFIAVAEVFNESNTFPMLRLGIRGIVEHAALERQLPRALETVSTGGYWVPRILLSDFVSSVLKTSRPRLEPSSVELSPRETEVMADLLDNLPNKEIAGRLGISERTVKFHVSNILRKFHVGRRADLILIGTQKAHGSRRETDRDE
jgi:DNA-binding NarL/FixJ family response regulator